MKAKSLFLFFIIFNLWALGQQQKINDKTLDSASFLGALKKTKIQVHLRNFFSQTTNEGKLSDYFANAIGSQVHLKTGNYKGFELQIKGSAGFNLFSSDLTQKDSLANAYNRYEVGLFDQQNFSNKWKIYRLDELSLSYQNKSGKYCLGRQMIQTPLINAQDGRMTPTLVSGIWIEQAILKQLKFKGGLINRLSPRGTTTFFKPGESIGIYGQGVNPSGLPHQFYGNVDLPFLFVSSLQFIPTKFIKYQGWDYHLPGLLNATFHQLDIYQSISDFIWLNSAQVMREWALIDSENLDPSISYISKGSKALTYGFQSKLIFPNWNYSVNYNRITAEGRYLFPREWGRDPFFTFMPRERNEGFGDVHAFVLKIENQNDQSIFKKSGVAFGYFQLPDVKNFMLNKYGMPSYFQFNLDLRVNLSNWMQGLEGQLLLVTKLGAAETYNNPKYQFNKVNILLTNFVLNYHF